MKSDHPKARESYFREASSWAHDQAESLRASRRVAWIVAAVAAVIAVCEAIALIFLTPLKTVEPYTLMVDKHTGFVQALKPLEAPKIAGDTALTQSFLVQYVIARESFEINTLQANYRKVALWSADSARSRYIAAMQPSFPDSPLNRYPRSTVIETQVKSVSPLGPEAAMVRFDTRRIDQQGGQAQLLGSWVAVIRYRFSGEPMRVEDRYVNPLGFQVIRYRRDAEALPPEPTPAPPPAPPPSALPSQLPATATVIPQGARP
ncbi:VirB8/TrbF family protein [Sphingomonas sp.]|uniref:virB8 family protein n=1 Tax=Sphingomonas sp. TaxID=28214 RepID=UPI0031E34585